MSTRVFLEAEQNTHGPKKQQKMGTRTRVLASITSKNREYSSMSTHFPLFFPKIQYSSTHVPNPRQVLARVYSRVYSFGLYSLDALACVHTVIQPIGAY